MKGIRFRLARPIRLFGGRLLWGRWAGIRWYCVVFVAVALFCLNAPRLEGDDAEPSELRPGLVEHVASEPSRLEVYTRIVPRPHLHGLSSDIARSPADPTVGDTIRLVWSGWWEAPTAGEYRFAVVTSGSTLLGIGDTADVLLVDDKAADADQDGPIPPTLRWRESNAIRVTADWHPLELQFAGAANAAHLTLYWQGPGFDWEPVPTRHFAHDADAHDLAAHDLGRRLFEQLRCGACHETPADPWTAKFQDLPPAPALDQLRGNLQHAWLVERLVDQPSPSVQTPVAGKDRDEGRRPNDHERNRGQVSEAGQAGEAVEDVDVDEDEDEDEDESESEYRVEPRDDVDLRLQVTQLARRMPHFAIDDEAARAIAAYLNVEMPSASAAESPSHLERQDAPDDSGKRKMIEAGQQIVYARGCLACHTIDDVGNAHGAGGGDLSRIATKRTPDFFQRWLTNPAELNRDHRMPIFRWKPQERDEVSAYLMSLAGSHESGSKQTGGTSTPFDSGNTGTSQSTWQRGKQLFERYRCHACHRGPEDTDVPRGINPKLPLDMTDESAPGCHLSVARFNDAQPRYELTERQRGALQMFLQRAGAASGDAPQRVRTRIEQLAELNCIGCHERDDHRGLAGHVGAITQRIKSLADEADALVPPTLNAVGDKLHRAALLNVLTGASAARRPWLAVRMPHFPLGDQAAERLADAIIAADRVPSRRLRQAGEFTWSELREDRAGEWAADVSASEARSPDLQRPNLQHPDVQRRDLNKEDLQSADLSGVSHRMAARRLVTSEGFGCASCHAIGPAVLPKTSPGTRGPDLRMIGQHVRASWFQRFVRQPVRTSRQLEMPSIQTAVRGVLGDNLDAQLAALWRSINDPHFEPPAADPLRTAYQTGDDPNARALLLTDVLRVGTTTYVKPLLVGLANRHNVLFDLESARLVGWSVGDCAAQYTEGKTWYWRSVGELILRRPGTRSDWSVLVEDQFVDAETRGQFVTQLDRLRFDKSEVTLEYVLSFAEGRETLHVQERLRPWKSDSGSGWERQIQVATRARQVRLSLGDGDAEALRWKIDATKRSLRQLGPPLASIDIQDDANVSLQPNGDLLFHRSTELGQTAEFSVTLHYHAPLQVEPHSARPAQGSLSQAMRVEAVPGFDGVRLPLGEEVMPTALAWGHDRELYLTSLKGRVWRAWDSDGDGDEDQLRPISPELAAPYGVSAGPGYVDVLTKYALLRLLDEDRDGDFTELRCVASGWGHTDDYHDWAVGLCRDLDGNYYIALPCQQDERSTAAAHLRGTTLQLVAPDDPHAADAQFRIQEISRGHRFPMGIARNREGQMVVTDNQGNYNPFNELNVVESGRHFGFINRLDRGKGEPSEVTEPAIAIPHPWTRSVNGICFLELPLDSMPEFAPESASDLPRKSSAFGPFQGHLVGCEYDTRRLIRMTMERVDGVWQGAAYPMSLEANAVAPDAGLLGPICCAVSPHGSLYIGGIRDSGWGGANNVGEVVRLQFNPDTLPGGIAEVRATTDGFELTFTRPVDNALASDLDRYTIHSYYRVRTPAYGGDDQDRRREKVAAITLSDDARRARLSLERFEPGRVYEIKVAPLARGQEPFFPAEAHYTLHRIPVK